MQTALHRFLLFIDQRSGLGDRRGNLRGGLRGLHRGLRQHAGRIRDFLTALLDLGEQCGKSLTHMLERTLHFAEFIAVLLRRKSLIAEITMEKVLADGSHAAERHADFPHDPPGEQAQEKDTDERHDGHVADGPPELGFIVFLNLLHIRERVLFQFAEIFLDGCRRILDGSDVVFEGFLVLALHQQVIALLHGIAELCPIFLASRDTSLDIRLIWCYTLVFFPMLFKFLDVAVISRNHIASLLLIRRFLRHDIGPGNGRVEKSNLHLANNELFSSQSTLRLDTLFIRLHILP